MTIFINEYKQLKKQLFKNFNISIASLNYFSQLIKQHTVKGQLNFHIPFKGKNDFHISNLIFAKNKNYYTIGISVKIDYIGNLVNLVQTTNTLNNKEMRLKRYA